MVECLPCQNDVSNWTNLLPRALDMLTLRTLIFGSASGERQSALEESKWKQPARPACCDVASLWG
jgi:hypothetical protein